jgi:hypothetical protein
MSSFIQEIKLSTTTSLDVIMKNGRAYRYIGIDPEVLLDLISDYAEIILEGGSVGRFYNEHIKGAYETEELETTTKDNVPDLKAILENLKEGRSILVGNKEELDELLKVIAEHYNVTINYQGLLKDYHSITGEGCITIRQGQLVILPVVAVGYANVVAYATIPRITTPIIVADKDSYFYDVTLSSKEEEQEQSEDDREPSKSDNVTDEGKHQDDKIELSEDDREPSEIENVKDEGKDQDDKRMVLQALNLLERVIGEKGYADTDILIKTIREYVEKQ